jgi:nitrogen fixation/metabolism regulation signal transduction histidine kinase
VPRIRQWRGTGLGIFIVRTVSGNHGACLEITRSKLDGAELRPATDAVPRDFRSDACAYAG